MPKLNIQYNRGLLAPETLNNDTREVEVTFATETPVLRSGWSEDYNEVPSCIRSSVRMDRINEGLPVIDSHNGSSVLCNIGRTTDVWFTDDKRICARIKFSQRYGVQGILQDIKDGIIRAVSVGYRVFSFEREPAGEGQTPTYRATDWMPHEISFVTVPADPACGVRSDSTQNEVQIINNLNINKKTRKMTKVTCPECGHQFDTEATGSVTCPECDATFDVSGEASDDERKNKDAGKRSASAPELPKPADVAAIRAQATADERKRLDAILVSSRAARLDDSVGIELYRSGKPLEECRHDIIARWVANSPPSVHGNHAAQVGKEAAGVKRQLAVDSIVGRAMPGKFKVAPDNPYRGQSITAILRHLMQERGVSVHAKSDAEIVNMSFAERAYSTSDLPLLMEDVMNKILRGDYQFAPENWQTISRQKLVPDYREQPFYQFETENGIKEIPEGGEIPYTKMIAAKQTIRVRDYGEGFKLTRQAVINDDLDVFAQIPARFVKDHDEFRGDKVWGMITGNVDMYDGKKLFDAAHLNVVTGTPSVFSEEGLKNALLIFRGQKALGDKRRINVHPKYLIVPPELEIEARKQLTAITASNTKDVNVFQNAYELIVERRLTDPKAWYLMADPSVVDGLYYANLQGEEGLRANREEKFNTDTIDYAIRFNFGVAAIDWRGIVKMAGA